MKCETVTARENPFVSVASGVITAVNEAFSALTGFSPADVCKKNIEDVLTTVLRIDWHVYRQLMLKQQETCYLFTKDLLPREVLIRLRPQGGDAYDLEVTEETGFRLEEQIAFIEQLFHDDHMKAAIYSVPDYVLLKANPSYLEFLDGPDTEPADFLGKPARDLKGLGSRLEENLDAVVRAGHTLHIDEQEIQDATYRNFTLVPVFIGNVLKFIFETSKDVTDRVVARQIKEARETELRLYKEKLEAIVNNMSDQLMIIRKDGYFEFFNKAAKELFDPIFGVTERLGGSRQKAEYFDMDNNPLDMESLPAWRVLQGEAAAGVRFKIRHSGWTVIEVNGTPVYDDKGELVYGILCCRDITELVSYEEKLLEQNRLLSAVIENMHDAISVFDRDGKISILNAVARRLYPQYDDQTSVNTVHDGYQCFDVSGHLIAADGLPTRRAFRGEPVRDERLIIKKGKEKRIIEVNATPIFDNGETLVSAVVSHHDITEAFRFQRQISRKNTQLQKKNILLREITDKLEHIIENTDDLILSVNIDCTIVMLNTAAGHHFMRYYDEELKIGMNLAELRHPVLRSRLIEICLRAAEEGKFQVDIRSYNSNIVMAYSVYPVYIKKEAVEIIISGKDITDRIRTESEIVKMNNYLENLVQERTKELQHSVRELQDFSMSVSHEMKTPLREIEYYAREIAGNRNVVPNGERVLKICHDQTELIDKLLKFSMSTKTELRKELVQIKKMIVSVFESVKTNMGLARAVLDFETGLPQVYADKTLLQQVLTNIISNALKFSSHRDVPKLLVGCRAEGNTYVFYFKDNGVGFSMQYVEKLFNIFERLHTSDEFEGSGIGLAIVKRIIKRHGGRVWIEGVENAGAVLSFTLPALDRPEG